MLAVKENTRAIVRVFVFPNGINIAIAFSLTIPLICLFVPEWHHIVYSISIYIHKLF